MSRGRGRGRGAKRVTGRLPADLYPGAPIIYLPIIYLSYLDSESREKKMNHVGALRPEK